MKKSGSNPSQNLRGGAKYTVDIDELVVAHTYSNNNYTFNWTSYFESAYWTSDTCIDEAGMDGGVTGFWTADFFTGVTRCEAADKSNYVIYVSDGE
jgi:hypothetical protein